MSSSARQRGRVVLLLVATAASLILIGSTTRLAGQTAGTGWTVVAWNNLGMHCMDADFGVFAILPPYNTIQAQVIDNNGNLVANSSGLTLTYQGVADPTGSINTTSAGKTNFWSFVGGLFGVTLPVDVGLLKHNMPGSGNAPQPMVFDPALNWFIAEGIPITPFDDHGVKNYYPLMKVTVSNSAGPLASTNIVLPVSDEMDCRACHASGSGPAARPAAGWVFNTNAQRDYRLNILRLHDDRQVGKSAYSTALATAGYSASGLYATATAATGAKSILCARCHKSEALAGSGMTGIPPLTSSIHTLHSSVIDPTNNLALESSDNRSACYRCHPGSETRCLRGVMGNTVAANGTMAIQCQNCHGPMSAVGSPARTGWLQEPSCQNCHTGTATQNSGAIRFTSVFDASGQPRIAANTTFATTANTPAAGLNLYRFSAGHGGLQCSACHGSTHAEFPSSHANDNLQSMALQGHAGTIAECGTCHSAVPSTTNGGPHGMHPVGAAWVSQHHDAIGGNPAQCQACHGTDYRGTVLSRAFGPRTLTSELGTKTLFRGAQVGCYMCHNGPSSESRNTNRPAVASNLSASTTAGSPVTIRLAATDPDGNALTFRVVSQPANGTVGLTGTTATYYPFAGFSGTDTFTYAAWDGSIDSNLATVTVSVGGQACTVASSASAPASGVVGTAVAFTGSATAANCSGTIAYDWNFGDGTPHSAFQSPTHTYASAGTFTWTMTATVAGVASTQTGSIAISAGGQACSLSSSASAPASGVVGTAVAFRASATATNCSGTIAYDWNFGDGTPHASIQNPTHAYASAGTFTWTMTATVAGVASSQRGSIAISTVQPAPAPTISSVRALSEPFRIQINGANFQTGVRVFIGTDTTAWPNTQRVSSQQIILSGSDLRNKFPRERTVSIRVVNPDGQSATTTFRR